ncbi:hypothetical protein J4429_05115 [Candidatus Pacearchaeota archaeon]|nr:hypothetical protein [Candidatus Pacearchaeota archaeon]
MEDLEDIAKKEISFYDENRRQPSDEGCFIYGTLFVMFASGATMLYHVYQNQIDSLIQYFLK